MSSAYCRPLEDILHRKQPSWWEIFKTEDPLLFVARRAFAACTPKPPLEPDDPQGSRSSPPRARVVCISDTHNHHSQLPRLPPGDVLIHAGDLTDSGTEKEVDSALAWLHAAPHAHKIVIAGNHDAALASDRRDAILRRYPSLTYLDDSSITIEVRDRLLSIYGNPKIPRGAFSYPLGGYSWKTHLPPVTDILVTHGPPRHHLDGKQIGCTSLLKAVARSRPRLHVCGHAHAGRGVRYLSWSTVQLWYERACEPSPSRSRRLLSTFLVVCAAAGSKILGRPVFRGDGGTILVNAASAEGVKVNLPIVIDVPLPERF